MRERELLARPILLLVSLTCIGTVGYMAIERLSPFDALYLTVTTVSTVGYGDVHPTTAGGRLFTVLLIVFGVGAALFTLTELVRLVYEGQFGRVLWRRRMERRVERLSDHYILCGYGRVGRRCAADLEHAGVPFVVIDRDPTGLQLARERGVLLVEGDAASDEVLKEAGVERARGLIAAIAEDADNIYVVLSARALNPSLSIVARANDADSIPKLNRAGADRVVSPYDIGGTRMAMLALRPLSVEFVDAVVQGQGTELLLEDVEVAAGSRLAGRTVDEVQSELAPGVSILAIKRASAILPRPALETRLDPGDELVAIGTPVELRRLEGLA